ncbi:MAG TPA: membrane protein insertion efficiency factor YidD [Candidatus Aminicenantes bacterium]|nr:membrane protein insertion efficiency factor YidD [Candidatus Aminicenantes bacterium]
MKALLLTVLKVYKRVLSPVMGRHCRFVPTCSEYAAGAIERFGALHGTWLALTRLLKCHPFHSGGFDPVPEKIEVSQTWIQND